TAASGGSTSHNCASTNDVNFSGIVRTHRSNESLKMCCLFAVQLRAFKPKASDYPKEVNTLGDHIRKKRLDEKLLQGEVAYRIGVDETTICNWETNRTEQNVRHMPRIIDFLGYVPYTSPKSFGEWLKACRTAAGLSQRRLAKSLGMDPTAVRDWENGKHR